MILFPGSLCFSELVMMSSAPAKKYTGMPDTLPEVRLFRQLTLSHIISTPVRTQLLSIPAYPTPKCVDENVVNFTGRPSFRGVNVERNSCGIGSHCCVVVFLFF